MKRKIALAFLAYLRNLAKIQLLKLNLLRALVGKKPIVVVGVTGSIGKTSTMLAVGAFLKNDFKVKLSEKANSESGIPLNILGLNVKNYSFLDWIKIAVLAPLKLLINWQDFDIYVVEMGVDDPEEPKNMTYLLKVIRPKIGIFIGVTSVHSMQFDKKIPTNIIDKKRLELIKNLIADEKFKLILSLPKSGRAILNMDDPFVAHRSKLVKVPTTKVGSKAPQDVLIKGYAVSSKGTEILLKINDRDYLIKIKNQALPRGYANNFGLALSVALELNLDINKAIDSLKNNLVLPPGRTTLLDGIKGSKIIDSSYNASPLAVNAMLDLFDTLGLKTKRRKILVFGDMRELGRQSSLEHKLIAQRAVKIADEIVLVGVETKKYFLPEALRLGFSKDKINHFENAFQAADFMKKRVSSNDLVLIKGSQNTIFLEIVVKALMKNKFRADRLLCRQSKFWENKRRRLNE